MKKECKNCVHFQNSICVKNSKNGYFNCAKFKALPTGNIEGLEEQKRQAYIAGDTEKAREFQKQIDWFNHGLK